MSIAAIADWIQPAVHIAQVVIGIGFLIFVHELGHFVVGRLCRVRAEAFSIGFGPILLRWKPGPTEYRISAVPLGGYVKFLGENPGEEGRAEPDSFPAATYPRKLAILLAGVTMNVLTALLLFAGVFRFGVDLPAPTIGYVEPGSPAWEHGLLEGDTFVEINGNRILDFEDVQQETVLRDEVEVVVRREGTLLPPRTIPTRPSPEGLRLLGIQPAIREDGTFSVVKDGPAWEAGFRPGDRVEAVDGKAVDTIEQALEAHRKAGRDTTWTLERDGETIGRMLPWSARTSWKIGVAPDSARIEGVRRGGPAWAAGLRPGDVPVAVGDVPTPSVISARRALEDGAPGPLVVERDAARVEVGLPPPEDAESREAFVASFASPPDGSARVSPWTGADQPPSPLAEAGMRPGSAVVSIDGAPIEDFDDIVAAVEAAQERGGAVSVAWTGPDGTPRSATIKPTKIEEPEFGGILPLLASVTVRESNIFKAMGLGVERTHRWVMRILGTLRSMIQGKIGRRVLAGPVAIARATYLKAEEGPGYLFLWLGVISMNLAVLNLLPIPLLDGGQIVVHTAERIRGKPIPERVLEGVQWAGLALILGLMVFVLSNDIINFLS